MDFERKIEIFKTHKNAYTGPLSITNPQYGGHDHSIRSFGPILPPNWLVSGKPYAPIDFEQKFELFKNL
jgi:hypothetical protein